MIDDIDAVESNWRSRGYGFPKEENQVIEVRKIPGERSGTDVEHGRKTWTPEQTARDFYQNHSDANLDRWIEESVGRIVNLEELDDRQTKELERFGNMLLMYKKYLESPATEEGKSREPDPEETREAFNYYCRTLPIKEGYRRGEGDVDMDKIKEAVAPKIPPPQIRYRVFDRLTGKRRWVDLEHFSLPEYREKTFPQKTSLESDFRYQIVGVEMSDRGSGFDPKLDWYYKSTKRRPSMAGQYGEGLKLNMASVLRNGGQIQQKSFYRAEDGHIRAWKQRPTVDKRGNVRLKGVEVDISQATVAQKNNLGSSTRIEFDRATSEFREKFVGTMDPRLDEGLGENFLAYSSRKYYYPPPALGAELAGIGEDSHSQYVQGIKVGEVEELGFSYDLPKAALAGRDRKALNSEAADKIIKRTWLRTNSPRLLRKLAEGTFSIFRGFSLAAAEEGAVEELLEYSSLSSDSQISRTAVALIKVLPSAIGVETGRVNVIAYKYMGNNPLLEHLRDAGANIIRSRMVLSPDACRKISEFHGNKFELYSLNYAGENPDLQDRYATAEVENTEEIRPLYKNALQELKRMYKAANLSEGKFNLDPSQYLRASNGKDPLSLRFNSRTHKFFLAVEAATIKKDLEWGYPPLRRKRWQRQMEVYLLAARDQERELFDQTAVLISSQRKAQKLLAATLPEGAENFQAAEAMPALPRSRESLLARSKQEARSLALDEKATLYYDAATTLELFHYSLKMEEFVDRLPDLPEMYRTAIYEALLGRVIVHSSKSDEEVIIFRPQDETYRPGQIPSGRLSVIRQPLKKLATGYKFQGKDIYSAGGFLFVPQYFPPNATIKIGKEKFVRYRDRVIRVEKNGAPDFSDYDFTYWRSGIRIENNCLVSPLIGTATKSAVRVFQERLSEAEITLPISSESPQMEKPGGIIKTPLPVDYGAGKWDDPVHVFEDIVQNHRDAAFGSNGKVELYYEVRQGRKRRWVREEKLTAEDQIVGFKITDNGDGYSPDGLGIMGRTSKSNNPFFAGKYGEGQKLIAAAAARNGLELSFSSQAEYQGQPRRWTAQVGKIRETFIDKGKQVDDQRVVFDLQSEKVGRWQSGPVSATILRLPDGGDLESEEWQRWLKAFDSRRKDKNGRGGLSRYILSLRKKEENNSIAIGPIEVLPNEPGAVYENGLFVDKVPWLEFGYNFPDVTDSRDRDHPDEEKVKKYLGYIVEHCRGDEYPRLVLHAIKENPNFLRMAQGIIPSFSKKDLNLGNLPSSGQRLGDISRAASSPWWREAYWQEIGDYFIHSQGNIMRSIASIDRGLKSQEASGDYRRQLEEERNSKIFVFSNVEHLSGHLLEVPPNRYYDWAALLPTAEEYVKKLSDKRISAPRDVARQLAEVAAASARSIRETLNFLKNTDPLFLRNAFPKPEDRESVEKRLRFWGNSKQITAENALFISPVEVGYNGLHTKGRIGINEGILSQPRKLAVTMDHELIHAIFGFKDYTPEFVTILLSMARANIRRKTASKS